MKSLGRRIERLEAEVAPSYERMLSDTEIAVKMVWMQHQGGALADRVNEILAKTNATREAQGLPVTNVLPRAR